MEDYQCRICLEDASLNQLFSPCMCNGTSKYVHRECLDTWRNQGDEVAFSKCFECNFEYILRYMHPKETFFIKVFNHHSINTNYCLYFASFFCILLAGWFFRVSDLRGHYILRYIQNFDQRKNYTMEIELLEIDEIYSTCYYFSAAWLINMVWPYLIYFSAVMLFLKRRCDYWFYMIPHFISSIVYSTHFIWFYHVCWGFDGYRHNSKDTGYFELFILTDALLSCFNLHVFQFLILEHNKILKKLNYEDNCTIIIEPNIVNVIV